ncbi:unannotated protein [freshwater metagenome]|uniref:Unannotated protein n=1 Tax=freshwater metagenome TaxID=449393 RepID=A0A6J6F473_9ZZZZ
MRIRHQDSDAVEADSLRKHLLGVVGYEFRLTLGDGHVCNTRIRVAICEEEDVLRKVGRTLLEEVVNVL